MILLSEKEKKFILDNVTDGQELIQKGNLRALLSAIDDLIVLQGFDINYALTDFGRQAQRIYDSVYYNNTTTP